MKPLQSLNRLPAPCFYFGGKGNMVSKLLRLIPSHYVYCEPYGGGAVLLLAKRPSPIEVYNDLDMKIVNLFRVLQDETQYQRLKHRLRHTLYARMEAVRSIELRKSDNPIIAAWGTFVNLNQGFNGIPMTRFGGWGRTFKSARGMSAATSKWCMRLSMLPDWHKRLLSVQIDCNDGVKVIKYWDRPDTFFYCDPPYVLNTRVSKNVYAHEMTDDQHHELIDTLLQVKGKVLLSGYNSPIYNVLKAKGWHKLEIKTACHAAVRNQSSGLRGAGSALVKVPRTEVLWMNYLPSIIP